MTTGPLRPLTTGELLDRTFALYREHFGLFFGITALPHLFSFALGLFANPLRIYLGLNFLGWVWLGALISVLVGAVAHAATVMAVSEIYLDRTTGVIDAYSKCNSTSLASYSSACWSRWARDSAHFSLSFPEFCWP